MRCHDGDFQAIQGGENLVVERYVCFCHWLFVEKETQPPCSFMTCVLRPQVKAVLWNLRSCPDWHPFVEYTEFKGNPKPDPTGAGAVRKCGFYKGANGIDYVWEEFLDMSDDKIITFIQEENRPSILKYVGKVFKIEPKDENTTILHVNHTYLPNYMPLSLPLAKFMMPSKMAHETYALGWCIKVSLGVT